jgi:tRNA(adenine34) deaminase
MGVALAAEARRRGDDPFGARIVGADGHKLAEGGNLVHTTADVTAHAEIVALRALGGVAGAPELSGATMYTSAEPCAMCAAAISFARIRRIYYGASDPKGGAVENGVRFFAAATCHHRPEVYGGIGDRAAAALLRKFFQARR